jgi:Na+/H+ antiporter NhaD/arsenite permease-like protein
VTHHVDVNPLLVVPFVLLLACIAVLPLFAHHFWENNRNKAIVSGLLALPIGIWLSLNASELLLHSALEYVSFIALLGALFVVSGGIFIEGDLEASPKTNVTLMGIGAVLANFIGTTGASMVLIRLLLRTNSQRRNTYHLPFFFILIVSNAGGLLTPLGDPPLFLGYLRGVPFFWTLRLFPLWLLGIAYLLTVLYVVDRRAYVAERPEDVLKDLSQVQKVKLQGKAHIGLLVGVVASVFLPSPYREIAMLVIALASLAMGPKDARRRNEFSYGPIVEVAVLFAGIFVTMVPALELLNVHGATLGLRQAWQYFLTTGVLSSVLDNAPTYLTFLSAAQGLGLPDEVVGVPHLHLLAISAGAVLMGANTYIGNGPNFMVKAIAESQGYHTPNFASYAGKAIVTLLPLYVVVTAYLYFT